MLQMKFILSSLHHIGTVHIRKHIVLCENYVPYVPMWCKKNPEKNFFAQIDKIISILALNLLAYVNGR